MDEAVKFSGRGAATAQPMGTYSSGTRTRLTFSITTPLVPDVLLIDETHSVGNRLEQDVLWYDGAVDHVIATDEQR